jgi:ketosteroid isomerase-like protein
MKKPILAVPLVLSACGLLSAQDRGVEGEIKRLEQAEVKAVLAKDTVTLARLWDKDYVVNNPENKIVLANADPVDRPVLKRPRTSFTRDVEHIAVTGDIAISMGSETVVPAGDLPDAGKTVKRRYTNIWMKKDGGWRLVARHANAICAER